MSQRRILLILALAALFIFATYRIVQNQPAAVKPAKQITTPCAKNGNPCIEITLEGGEVYKLNDFRFRPNQCIDFISLPDHKMHNWCSKYQMKWIGPDPSAKSV